MFSVGFVSSFDITSHVDSNHLPVSIKARANHVSEAASKKGNAEYCEIKTFFKMFDAQIRPVVLYGSEVLTDEIS